MKINFNDYVMENIALGMAIALGAALTYYLLLVTYQEGYYHGYEQREDEVSHVKIRTIKEGNIFKYPFRKTERETAESSRSDCLTQSGPQSRTDITKPEPEAPEGA